MGGWHVQCRRVHCEPAVCAILLAKIEHKTSDARFDAGFRHRFTGILQANVHFTCTCPSSVLDEWKSIPGTALPGADLDCLVNGIKENS